MSQLSEPVQDNVIERKKLIKTFNASTKQEIWCLVLRVDGDHVLCFKLGTGQYLEQFPEIRLDGMEEPMYVNVAAGTINIDITKADVREIYGKPVSDTVYNKTIASFVKCMFDGFVYKDETGKYVMIPMFTCEPMELLMYGVQNLSQSKAYLERSAINLEERKEANKKRAAKNRVDRLPIMLKGQSFTNIIKRTGIYSRDMQERVDSIYKIFTEFLSDHGELSIMMAHDALFKDNRSYRKTSKNSKGNLSKEDFLFVLNNDSNSVATRFHISLGYANTIKTKVHDLAEGKKVSRRFDDATTIARSLKKNGMSAEDIERTLIDSGKSESEALSAVRNSYRRASKRSDEKQLPSDIDNKLLNVMDSDYVQFYDHIERVSDYVATYSAEPDTDKLDIVDSHDPMDLLMTSYIVYKAKSSRTWPVMFSSSDSAPYIEFLTHVSVGDIKDRYFKKFDINPRKYRDFVYTMIPIFKVFASLAARDDEDKKRWKEAAKTDQGLANMMPGLLCYLIRTRKMMFSMAILRYLAMYIDIDGVNEDRILRCGRMRNVSYEEAYSEV